MGAFLSERRNAVFCATAYEWREPDFRFLRKLSSNKNNCRSPRIDGYIATATTYPCRFRLDAVPRAAPLEEKMRLMICLALSLVVALASDGLQAQQKRAQQQKAAVAQNALFKKLDRDGNGSLSRGEFFSVRLAVVEKRKSAKPRGKSDSRMSAEQRKRRIEQQKK